MIKAKLTHTLESITDYWDIKLSYEETQEVLSRIDDHDTMEEMEISVNKYLMSIGYDYDVETCRWFKVKEV